MTNKNKMLVIGLGVAAVGIIVPVVKFAYQLGKKKGQNQNLLDDTISRLDEKLDPKAEDAISKIIENLNLELGQSNLSRVNVKPESVKPESLFFSDVLNGEIEDNSSDEEIVNKEDEGKPEQFIFNKEETPEWFKEDGKNIVFGDEYYITPDGAKLSKIAKVFFPDGTLKHYIKTGDVVSRNPDGSVEVLK